MSFYVYMLMCSDKTLYTGYTNDVPKRLADHNKGNGAKYTRSRLPCKLVWACAFDTKSAAMKREYEIKQLSRKEKLRMLIVHPKNWPTLAGRLNQPLTSRGEALEHMKANGDVLSPKAEQYLERYLHDKKTH